MNCLALKRFVFFSFELCLRISCLSGSTVLKGLQGRIFCLKALLLYSIRPFSDFVNPGRVHQSTAGAPGLLFEAWWLQRNLSFMASRPKKEGQAAANCQLHTSSQRFHRLHHQETLRMSSSAIYVYLGSLTNSKMPEQHIQAVQERTSC